MPRDDIHNVTDLLRVINTEVPTTADVIQTPFTSTDTRRRRGPFTGANEADVVQRAILGVLTPENGYEMDARERADFLLKADRTRYSRLTQAVQNGERQNRFR